MSATFIHGHAVLIGVGGDLPVTANDAQAVHDLLVDPRRAAYPASQVDLLTEATADREGILQTLDRLSARVQGDPAATVVIYFSGHGGRYQASEATPRSYLVPYGYDPARLAATAITDSEFSEKVQAISARKVLVILDCCHAGGLPLVKDAPASFVSEPIPPRLEQLLATGSGLVVVSSSRAYEKSYAGARHSVFTACLLEALQGQATGGRDGYARLLEVLAYLFDQVPKRAAGPQHPMIPRIRDLTDNFPICAVAGVAKSDPAALVIAGPVPAGARQRLQQQLDQERRVWNLYHQKVSRLADALAIETDPLRIFQYEQQLLTEQARLAAVGNRLATIEQHLNG